MSLGVVGKSGIVPGKDSEINFLEDLEKFIRQWLWGNLVAGDVYEDGTIRNAGFDGK